MSQAEEHKVAPDVDLASRGLSNHVRLGLLALVFGVIAYSFRPAPGADGEELGGSAETAWWILGYVTWGVSRLLMLAAALAFTMLVVLIVKQRSIVYVPTPPGAQRSPADNPFGYRNPGNLRMLYEDVSIIAADGTRLHAWLIYQSLESCKDDVPFTFVYFHGNAGNIGHRMENIRDMHDKLKVNILIVDYRGYGDSEDGDNPSQRGFIMDAFATYKYLMGRIKNSSSPARVKMSTDRVLIFGRSIGGAVAIMLMAKLLREHLEQGGSSLPLPAGLILENSFTSIKEMATTVFPFLKPLKFLLRPPLLFDPWQASEELQYIAEHYEPWCCCLLSGAKDQLVPPSQMRYLHSVLKTNRPRVLKYFIFKEGGHNDTPTRGGAAYWESFQQFMSLVAGSEEGRTSGIAQG